MKDGTGQRGVIYIYGGARLSLAVTRSIWDLAEPHPADFSLYAFAANPILVAACRPVRNASSAAHACGTVHPPHRKTPNTWRFRICVNRRVLRASPDSVASGRAAFLCGRQAFGNVSKFRRLHSTDLIGKVHGPPVAFVPEEAICQTIIRQYSN
jgi:hypothetical protein